MNDTERRLVIPQLSMGDRLRIVRREYLGAINQGEMAALLGVPRERYAQWETGRHEPRPAESRRIATFLEQRTGVSAAWILGMYESGPGPVGGDGAAVLMEILRQFGTAIQAA